jgi:hypothetical protein
LTKDLPLSRRQLVDVSVGVAILYAAVWIYELGNLVALSAVGSQASLVFSGILPIGVSASVPHTNLLMFAKPAQIALSTLTMLALFSLVRSMKLQFSLNVTLTMASIYLASAYWELLSSVGTISYEAHLAIFATLAIGAQVGLSSLFKA